MDPKETLRSIGGKSRKKSGGSKKHGRSLVKCARYRAEGRREKNKARRKAKYGKRMARLRAKRMEAVNSSSISD